MEPEYLGRYLILLGIGANLTDCKYYTFIHFIFHLFPLGVLKLKFLVFFFFFLLYKDILNLLQWLARHVHGGHHSFHHITVDKLNWTVSVCSLSSLIHWIKMEILRAGTIDFSDLSCLSGGYLICRDQVGHFLICRIWKFWNICKFYVT